MGPQEVSRRLANGNTISPLGNIPNLCDMMPIVPRSQLERSDVKDWLRGHVARVHTRFSFVTSERGSKTIRPILQTGYALVNGRRRPSTIPVPKRSEWLHMAGRNLGKENLPKFHSVLPPWAWNVFMISISPPR